MRQSATNHSLIPIRTNVTELKDRLKRLETSNSQQQSKQPNVISSNSSSTPNQMILPEHPQRGLGITVSPIRRIPVRAPPANVFSNATMVNTSSEPSASASQNSSTKTAGARALQPPSKLSEAFRTPIIGTKEDTESPSPSYSTSLSPAFNVRNLDEDPHTGLTPTVQTFVLKTRVKETSRLSSQLPSPPSSPNESPENTRSRIPRRSKDDLSLQASSRKLQEASTISRRPRRQSIPSPLRLNNSVKKPEIKMTVPLAPPAAI